MRKLNKQITKRDKIIFPEGYQPEKYLGGVRHFEGLSLDSLEQLVADNFVDLDERQNSAPSIGAILEFMRKYPDYKAHGYTVTILRDDYRVSIEGVAKDNGTDSKQELEDFKNLFMYADELTLYPMYAWFD